jgi:hypothetical protein
MNVKDWLMILFCLHLWLEIINLIHIFNLILNYLITYHTYSQMICDISIVKTLVIPLKRLYSLSTYMKDLIKDNRYIIIVRV